MNFGRKYQSSEFRIPLKDAREVFFKGEDPKSLARLHNFDFRVVETLRAAVEDPRWLYRTVGGLGVDTGLPEDQVSQMLKATRAGRESPLRTKEREKLYRGVDTPMNFPEIYEAIRRILAEDI